jgi:multimeric flavodoxin WrbA
MPFFVHHGLICAASFCSLSVLEKASLTFVSTSPDVPIGYTQPALTDNTEIVGGTAYGAAAIAGGDGSRQPTEKELKLAEFQGTHFASTVSTYVKGYGDLSCHFLTFSKS